MARKPMAPEVRSEIAQLRETRKKRVQQFGLEIADLYEKIRQLKENQEKFDSHFKKTINMLLEQTKRERRSAEAVVARWLRRKQYRDSLNITK